MGKDVYEEIFLEKQIVFLDVDDLFRRIKDIRQGYLSLEKGVQRVYKWYFFYQLCLLKKADNLKGSMWSYLNSLDENCEFVFLQVLVDYEYFNELRNSLINKKQI